MLADAAFEALVIHRDGRILHVNGAFGDLVGDPGGAAEGLPILDLFPLDERAGIASRMDADGDLPAETRIVRTDGSEVAVEMLGRAIGGAEDAGLRVTALRAVQPRRAADDHAADGRALRPILHDPVTGLPDRPLFVRIVAAALAQGVRDERPRLAVLLVDLEHHRALVERFGRAVGDGIVAAVGRRFAEAARPEESLAHFGDGLFAMLAPEADGEAGARRAASRLLASLAAPFPVDERSYHLGAHAGIALSMSVEATPVGLIDGAAVALERAKADPTDRIAVFSPAMSVASVERIALEAELRRALERQELEVFYQPLVDLGTGLVVSHEALVRWRHPTRGLLSPYHFVPLSEETGLVIPLGEQVLAEACRQTREWQRRFPLDPPLAISVNISALALARPGATASILAGVAASGLSPASLEIEVTETIVMRDPEEAAVILGGLHDVGIHLGLDDFGTGYSSLAYISRLPFDTIKIDRAFITGIETSRLHQSIVSAVVALSKGLRAHALAEGIERQEELDTVVALGCHRGQGYIFGKPVGAADAEAVLDRMYGR